MSSDNNDNTPEAQPGNNNNSNNNHPGRSIFSVTMDPAAIEQEIDHAAQALHSTVNTLLNTMQSSVFGGLETLSREMSALERQSKSFLDHHQQFPWSLRSDGPKKRYRITIEELPALDPSTKTTSTSSSSTSTTVATGDDDFSITQGMAGTVDEGKTVITASVAPGLLDWLLFTTHEDSFFRRLGQGSQDDKSIDYDVVGGTKITELKDSDAITASAEQETAKARIVPAIVEKVKQVGTSWEKDARHWWRKGSDESKKELDPQHHLVVGSNGYSEENYDDERYSRRWPRSRHWESSESYSQTTVTRPDGTVETRIVNSVNGETETKIRIVHNDGSIEETVKRESARDHGSSGRWGRRRDNQLEEDRERDLVVPAVAEAAETEKAEGKRSWPPKAWVRRHERDE
ncbi:hypothetical protein MVEG_09250 [Podila verticillata NRRL 6337]|nr:MAG: hypothetical protein BYD32DRAFT_414122 [Podila humilis]KFH64517.1 hypothetical protein MVEG_09250 [Podila verticillata NRRL 6337]